MYSALLGACKESIGEKGVNQSVRTAVSHMHGDIKFGMFNASYKGQLESLVNDKVKSGEWDTADLAAAYVAMGEVLKAIDTGKDSNGKSIGYDYLDRNGNNMEILQNIFFKEVNKARPVIEKELAEEYGVQKGGNKEVRRDEDNEESMNYYSRAANNILKKKKDQLMTDAVNPLKDSYGEAADFKFDQMPKEAKSYSGPRKNNSIPLTRGGEGR